MQTKITYAKIKRVFDDARPNSRDAPAVFSAFDALYKYDRDYWRTNLDRAPIVESVNAYVIAFNRRVDAYAVDADPENVNYILYEYAKRGALETFVEELEHGLFMAAAEDKTIKRDKFTDREHGEIVARFNAIVWPCLDVDGPC